MICCPNHTAHHHCNAGADLLGVRFFLGQDSSSFYALAGGSWAFVFLCFGHSWAFVFLVLGETLTSLGPKFSRTSSDTMKLRPLL